MLVDNAKLFPGVGHDAESLPLFHDVNWDINSAVS
jgi:hypothetical protein